MTLLAWIFMLSSVSFVVGLMAWCYWRLLRHKKD